MFKVKPTTRFEKILNAFCTKKSVDVTQAGGVVAGRRCGTLSRAAEHVPLGCAGGPRLGALTRAGEHLGP